MSALQRGDSLDEELWASQTRRAWRARTQPGQDPSADSSRSGYTSRAEGLSQDTTHGHREGPRTDLLLDADADIGAAKRNALLRRPSASQLSFRSQQRVISAAVQEGARMDFELMSVELAVKQAHASGNYNPPRLVVAAPKPPGQQPASSRDVHWQLQFAGGDKATHWSATRDLAASPARGRRRSFASTSDSPGDYPSKPPAVPRQPPHQTQLQQQQQAQVQMQMQQQQAQQQYEQQHQHQHQHQTQLELQKMQQLMLLRGGSPARATSATRQLRHSFAGGSPPPGPRLHQSPRTSTAGGGAMGCGSPPPGSRLNQSPCTSTGGGSPWGGGSPPPGPRFNQSPRTSTAGGGGSTPPGPRSPRTSTAGGGATSAARALRLSTLSVGSVTLPWLIQGTDPAADADKYSNHNNGGGGDGGSSNGALHRAASASLSPWSNTSGGPAAAATRSTDGSEPSPTSQQQQQPRSRFSIQSSPGSLTPRQSRVRASWSGEGISASPGGGTFASQGGGISGSQDGGISTSRGAGAAPAWQQLEPLPGLVSGLISGPVLGQLQAQAHARVPAQAARAAFQSSSRTLSVRSLLQQQQQAGVAAAMSNTVSGRDWQRLAGDTLQQRTRSLGTINLGSSSNGRPIPPPPPALTTQRSTSVEHPLTNYLLSVLSDSGGPTDTLGSGEAERALSNRSSGSKEGEEAGSEVGDGRGSWGEGAHAAMEKLLEDMAPKQAPAQSCGNKEGEGGDEKSAQGFVERDGGKGMKGEQVADDDGGGEAGEEKNEEGEEEAGTFYRYRLPPQTPSTPTLLPQPPPPRAVATRRSPAAVEVSTLPSRRTPPPLPPSPSPPRRFVFGSASALVTSGFGATATSGFGATATSGFSAGQAGKGGPGGGSGGHGQAGAGRSPRPTGGG